MSDSLRDQLLNAGFKEPVQARRKPQNRKPRSKASKGAQGASGRGRTPESAQQNKQQRRTGQAAEAVEVARRKALKAEIRSLIENHRTDNYSGEIAHRYIVGSRIKQLFVSAAVHQRIVAGELIITRLNGSTQLVPPDIADRIQALNPDWAIVRPAESTGVEDEAYASFTVPDDLQW
jgi:uncharacterized protein YaiL (DUF2058 family)